MKSVVSAGMAGLAIAVTPAISIGQNITLGARVPSVAPRHLVCYNYQFKKQTTGAEAQESALSGRVEISSDNNTLYYREYRDSKKYREVLYNRKDNSTLLFNHQQNKLNLFGDMPYDAVRFIPFPFDDQEILSIVQMATAKEQEFPPGKKAVSFPSTLRNNHNPVAVQFLVTSTPPGSQVSRFSIKAPDGNVADWAFTYASKASALPATITRTVSQPFMTDAEKQRFMRHEPVPPIHWKPDAEIQYTFVEDRLLAEGDLPSEKTLVQGVDEKTVIVDRRDLKNPVSFRYDRNGGDFETQLQAARLRGPATRAVSTTERFWNAGKYLLLAPVLLCVGWGIWGARRRMATTSEARI